jgi:transposase
LVCIFQKEKSQVQAYLDKGEPYRKSFKVSHTIEGPSYLVTFLEDVKKESGKKTSIILKATGHYQTPVVHYLEERGYLLIIINPLISYKARGSSLRKVKTDAIDAYLLCELFYIWTSHIINLSLVGFDIICHDY